MYGFCPGVKETKILKKVRKLGKLFQTKNGKTSFSFFSKKTNKI
jgi:hypothetical protein